MEHSPDKKLAVTSTVNRLARLNLNSETIKQTLKQTHNLTDEDAEFFLHNTFNRCRACGSIFNIGAYKSKEGCVKTYCSVVCIVESKMIKVANGCIELHFTQFIVEGKLYGVRHAYYLYKGIPYKEGSRFKNNCKNSKCVNPSHASPYTKMLKSSLTISENALTTVREIFDEMGNDIRTPLYKDIIQKTIISQITEEIVKSDFLRARFGVGVVKDFIEYLDEKNVQQPENAQDYDELPR
ncbi:MAG: hypothetical protein Q8Q33_02005 [Chlamydiota bacterium]|nr:hypothetical protein [Chlamydiota bacterium]